MRAQSTREPVVLLIDDLHCSDADSERFVDRLVEAMADTPTLLIVNFRPGYRVPWMERAAGSPARGYRELALAPPDAASVRALLRALLGEDASFGELPRLVHEQTRGNPFFIEEVVRWLVEQGALVSAAAGPVTAGDAAAQPAGPPPYVLVRPVTEIRIPATVHAVIAARVDRLAEREKQMLQAAAVIGKTFAIPVLERVLRLGAGELAAALDALRHAGLIDGDPLAPERAHAFRHPLVQEVAYQAQLVDQRARLHVAAARALEELHADTLGQHAALIAHHYDAANYRYEAARWRRRALLQVTHIQVPRRAPKARPE